MRAAVLATNSSRALPSREVTTQLYVRQAIVELAGAVTEALRGHAKLGHQGQRQIRQRGTLRVPEVAIPLEMQVPPADDHHRNTVIVVDIAVAQPLSTW